MIENHQVSVAEALVAAAVNPMFLLPSRRSLSTLTLSLSLRTVPHLDGAGDRGLGRGGGAKRNIRDGEH